jgi:hypothetical protein
VLGALGSDVDAIDTPPRTIQTARAETPPPLVADNEEKLPLTPFGAEDDVVTIVADPTLEYTPTTNSEELMSTNGDEVAIVPIPDADTVVVEPSVPESQYSGSVMEEEANTKEHRLEAAMADLDHFLSTKTIAADNVIDDVVILNPKQLGTIPADQDDSEHKDDGIASLSAPKVTAEPSDHTLGSASVVLGGLVSSDDFETSLLLEDQEDSGDCDVNTLITVADEPVPALQTELHAAALRTVPDVSSVDADVMECPPVIEPVEDVRTTIDANYTTKKPKEANVSTFNSAKESKDSWLEDYDEAAETSDTLMSLADARPSQKDFFPHSASPKISRRFQNASMNDSYDEEFPSDIIQQPLLSSGRKSKIKHGSLKDFPEELVALPEGLPTARRTDASSGSTLLSSIDAFEASFNTDFPDSFTPKDGSTPTTSPLEKVLSSTVIYDPFLPIGSPEVPSDRAAPLAGADSESRKGGMNWGSGIRDRAVAAFQRNSRRGGGADPPGNDQTSHSPMKLASSARLNATSSRIQPSDSKVKEQSDPTTIAQSEPVLQPHPAETANDMAPPVDIQPITDTEKTDVTTRWLNEVKASTDKIASDVQKFPPLNGLSVVAPPHYAEKTRAQNDFKALPNNKMLDSAPSPVVGRLTTSASDGIQSSNHRSKMLDSSPSPVVSRMTTNASEVAQSSTLLASAVGTPTLRSSVEDNTPVFRQFPRTAPLSPSSPSLRPSLTVVVRNDDKFDMNRYSTPITDSDIVQSPAGIVEDLEHMNAVGFDSVRARYEKAVAPRGGTVGSTTSTMNDAGRSTSRSRRLESRRAAAQGDSPNGLGVVANGDADRIAANVNVRERAAKFAGQSSAGGGSGSGTRSRSTWRTSNGSMEDSGDIPMRTSLSPRKLRSDDWVAAPPVVKTISPTSSDAPSDGLKPVALRSWRQRERSNDAESEQDRDGVGRGRVQAVVFNGDDAGLSSRHRDLGRQRRHINLSGTTRQIRQADRGDGASPLRGTNRVISREV